MKTFKDFVYEELKSIPCSRSKFTASATHSKLTPKKKTGLEQQSLKGRTKSNNIPKTKDLDKASEVKK